MKYAVFLLALMFVGVATPSMAQKLTFEFEGKTIEVAEKDFPNKMNWYDAMTACKNLGNGWRLPSLQELLAMYNQLHKEGKGNFRRGVWYWSSSEGLADDAGYFNFGYEKAYLWPKRYSRDARAVRTLP